MIWNSDSLNARIRLILCCVVGYLALRAATQSARAEPEIAEVAGQAAFSFEYAGATDFSGIVWIGGSDYLAVSDKVKGIFPLRIEVEPASGKILSAQFGTMIPVKTQASDFEGIAYDPSDRSVCISTEGGNSILAVNLKRGIAMASRMPAVFARARLNKGLESLTFDAKLGNFWTANEEALDGDGPVGAPEQGSLVRLQKIDRRLKPIAQFAYRTEPSKIRMLGAGTGVADLTLLPTGDLLVLERVAGPLGLSVMIFQADTKGATDVSKFARLEGAEFRPASKKLLFSRATLTNNFEGITLGPPLEGGWRSLILIADSGGGTTHFLMPLRLRLEAEKR